MKTRLTELLGIEKPVVQGGMAWVAEHTLAAAVSNAGGAGIIAGGSAPGEHIRNEIREAKKLTSKPFGVNIMLMAPNADDLAKIVIEENVAFVTTGAGNPGKYMADWKAAGIKVIPVVPTVNLAKRMERSGADAVIAEGGESGGHIGENSTMCLVPQVVDALKIPVLLAGGVGDGRGLAAALALGASGVQVGTRFLVADECVIHDNFKQLVLDAKDTGTLVTGRSTGHPCRSVKTKFMKYLLEHFDAGDRTPDEFEQVTLGSLRKAVLDGNIDEGTFLCGAIAGMVNKRETALAIVDDIVNGAADVLKNLKS